MFKAIQSYSKQALREFGISGPQLWLLRTLEDHGPLSVGDLADRMYLHISTVSGVVDRLQRRRLAGRQRDDRDRRVVRIRLTRRGRNLLRNAPEPAQGKLLYGLERLSRAELRRLRGSITKLVEIMEAQSIKATFFFEDSA
jgi:DNA-binding MarR family transcriptional regulator